MSIVVYYVLYSIIKYNNLDFIVTFGIRTIIVYPISNDCLFIYIYMNIFIYETHIHVYHNIYINIYIYIYIYICICVYNTLNVTLYTSLLFIILYDILKLNKGL